MWYHDTTSHGGSVEAWGGRPSRDLRGGSTAATSTPCWRSPSKVARPATLEGDRQQGVEVAAVADDDAFGQHQPPGLVPQPVAIDAGCEQVGAAIAHDAGDQERRLRRDPVGVGRADDRQAKN